MTKIHRATLSALTLLLATSSSAQTLQNPGFEGDYPLVNPTGDTSNANAKINGQVAPGWSDNSDWADVGVTYGRDTQKPHRGTASQRLTITRIGSGAVQFVQATKFTKGHAYRFSVWLRGRPGQVVTLFLRQGGAPYAIYGETKALLSAEWQQFAVSGQVNEDTDGFLMLRAVEPMTFFADDATLEDLTNAVSNRAPRTGNLLSGGEFELAQPFGWNARVEGSPSVVFFDSRPKLTRDAAQGRGAWSLLLPETVDGGTVQGPTTTLNFGRPHTMSAWMKADGDGTNAYWSLEGTDLGQGFPLTNEWKRYTWTFTPPFQVVSRLRFGFGASKQKRTVFLDGVMLEEAATTSEFAPSAPLSLSLTLNHAGHVVHPNEDAPILVNTSGTVPRGAKLTLKVFDVNQRARALPTIPLAKRFPVPAMNNRQGIWKLRAQAVDAQGKALSSPVELVWARLPKPKNIAPEKSFFGLHTPLSARYIEIARVTGQRQLRLHDASMIAKWAIVEPERGQRLYYDEAVNLARKNGLAILGMLDGAPAWTSTQPRTNEGGYWNIWNIPDKPDALEAWRSYVRDVTAHYKGRIDTWEVWNEPWGGWWQDSKNPNATPELYAQLLRIARDEAKRANPKATIIGIDTIAYARDKWTIPTLKAARDNPFDAFSFHDYNDSLYGGPDSPALRDTKVYRADLKTFGSVKPLWNTEGGPAGVGSFYAPETGGLPTSQQASWATRFDVSYMASGTKAFFLYSVPSDPAFGEITYRANEWDNAVKPVLAARAVLASLVDGVGQPKRTEPKPGLDLYTFPNGVRVAWSYNGAEHTMNVPRGLRAMDVWGNALPRAAKVKVNAEPIYFVR